MPRPTATLLAAGRLGEAGAAHDAHVGTISELAVPTADHDTVVAAS
jgi:hypothetical protein